MTDGVRATLPDSDLHGSATGDFGQCLHLMLGEDPPLSNSTIVQLKETWKKEYFEWKHRQLQDEYLYVWLDGVYPKAGPKDDKMALLVAVGVNRRGQKELLAIEEGYRESFESWRDLLRDLKMGFMKWSLMEVNCHQVSIFTQLKSI